MEYSLLGIRMGGNTLSKVLVSSLCLSPFVATAIGVPLGLQYESTSKESAELKEELETQRFINEDKEDELKTTKTELIDTKNRIQASKNIDYLTRFINSRPNFFGQAKSKANQQVK